MFTPAEAALERGWPGRIDGDTVIQLAAQTLQAFFTGGFTAREHARYLLADVLLRAPVLEPPAVRLFDSPDEFSFANPAAIRSPGAVVARPEGRLDVAMRLAALIGYDGEIAGFTGLAEWRAPELDPPKDRDFALLLGPVVETDLDGGPEWDDGALACGREHAPAAGRRARRAGARAARGRPERARRARLRRPRPASRDGRLTTCRWSVPVCRQSGRRSSSPRPAPRRVPR